MYIIDPYQLINILKWYPTYCTFTLTTGVHIFCGDPNKLQTSWDTVDINMWQKLVSELVLTDMGAISFVISAQYASYAEYSDAMAIEYSLGVSSPPTHSYRLWYSLYFSKEKNQILTLNKLSVSEQICINHGGKSPHDFYIISGSYISHLPKCLFI